MLCVCSLILVLLLLLVSLSSLLDQLSLALLSLLFWRRRGLASSLASSYRTVSFHNFKSQNFKLSVSNPKSKHVAYVSVLFQISNCQGLGRKTKHEILKTDRIVHALFFYQRHERRIISCNCECCYSISYVII